MKLFLLLLSFAASNFSFAAAPPCTNPSNILILPKQICKIKMADVGYDSPADKVNFSLLAVGAASCDLGGVPLSPVWYAMEANTSLAKLIAGMALYVRTNNNAVLNVTYCPVQSGYVIIREASIDYVNYNTNP